MDEKNLGISREELQELDKGIEDMQSNRVTPHEESMQILKLRYNEYVLQNTSNWCCAKEFNSYIIEKYQYVSD